jgi:hypothetical protein
MFQPVCEVDRFMEWPNFCPFRRLVPSVIHSVDWSETCSSSAESHFNAIRRKRSSSTQLILPWFHNKTLILVKVTQKLAAEWFYYVGDVLLRFNSKMIQQGWNKSAGLCKDRHYWRPVVLYNAVTIILYGGTRWRSWLRNCASNPKVVESIPDGVIGTFH